MYTDDELERLLHEHEADRVEFKQSMADRTKIRKTITAFANDLPGNGRPGVIFIGVKDDGTPSNLATTENFQEIIPLIANMRGDGSIQPLPTMFVEKRTLLGADMIVVTVQPSTRPPVRYENRVWVRVGSTLQLASPEEEIRLSERRKSKDLPFDHEPVDGAGLDDLDLDFFSKSYLPSAVAADVLEQNRRTLQQQLISLRLLSPGGQPTYGGILAIGKMPRDFVPGAYAQFLRFDGVDLSSPIKYEKEIDGPLCHVLSLLDEVMEINISTVVDALSGALEIRRPDYPIAALRQLARNAIMHRNYESSNAPVRVNWFADRVEIMNPGGLYGQLNSANFGTGVTDYRNPLVAESMKVLGYAQRFGIGIALARKEAAENGNPEPEFYFEGSSFTVILRRAQ